MAIDGATIVSGAPLEDSAGGDPADNSMANAGAAYVLHARFHSFLPRIVRP